MWDGVRVKAIVHVQIGQLDKHYFFKRNICQVISFIYFPNKICNCGTQKNCNNFNMGHIE